MRNLTGAIHAKLNNKPTTTWRTCVIFTFFAFLSWMEGSLPVPLRALPEDLSPSDMLVWASLSFLTANYGDLDALFNLLNKMVIVNIGLCKKQLVIKYACKDGRHLNIMLLKKCPTFLMAQLFTFMCAVALSTTVPTNAMMYMWGWIWNACNNQHNGIGRMKMPIIAPLTAEIAWMFSADFATDRIGAFTINGARQVTPQEITAFGQKEGQVNLALAILGLTAGVVGLPPPNMAQPIAAASPPITFGILDFTGDIEIDPVLLDFLNNSS